MLQTTMSSFLTTTAAYDMALATASVTAGGPSDNSKGASAAAKYAAAINLMERRAIQCDGAAIFLASLDDDDEPDVDGSGTDGIRMAKGTAVMTDAIASVMNVLTKIPMPEGPSNHVKTTRPALLSCNGNGESMYPFHEGSPAQEVMLYDEVLNGNPALLKTMLVKSAGQWETTGAEVSVVRTDVTGAMVLPSVNGSWSSGVLVHPDFIRSDGYANTLTQKAISTASADIEVNLGRYFVGGDVTTRISETQGFLYPAIITQSGDTTTATVCGEMVKAVCSLGGTTSGGFYGNENYGRHRIMTGAVKMSFDPKTEMPGMIFFYMTTQHRNVGLEYVGAGDSGDDKLVGFKEWIQNKSTMTIYQNLSLNGAHSGKVSYISQLTGDWQTCGNRAIYEVLPEVNLDRRSEALPYGTLYQTIGSLQHKYGDSFPVLSSVVKKMLSASSFPGDDTLIGICKMLMTANNPASVAHAIVAQKTLFGMTSEARSSINRSYAV
jgi:hypothetical protein